MGRTETPRHGGPPRGSTGPPTLQGCALDRCREEAGGGMGAAWQYQGPRLATLPDIFFAGQAPFFALSSSCRCLLSSRAAVAASRATAGPPLTDGPPAKDTYGQAPGPPSPAVRLIHAQCDRRERMEPRPSPFLHPTGVPIDRRVVAVGYETSCPLIGRLVSTRSTYTRKGTPYSY